jgi:hypothetical protein
MIRLYAYDDCSGDPRLVGNFTCSLDDAILSLERFMQGIEPPGRGPSFTISKTSEFSWEIGLLCTAGSARAHEVARLLAGDKIGGDNGTGEIVYRLIRDLSLPECYQPEKSAIQHVRFP